MYEEFTVATTKEGKKFFYVFYEGLCLHLGTAEAMSSLIKPTDGMYQSRGMQHGRPLGILWSQDLLDTLLEIVVGKALLMRQELIKMLRSIGDVDLDKLDLERPPFNLGYMSTLRKDALGLMKMAERYRGELEETYVPKEIARDIAGACMNEVMDEDLRVLVR